MSLSAVPTLAEIAADPDRIAALPGPLAAAYASALAGLQMSCVLRAALAGQEGALGEDFGSVSLDEAAQILGISPATLKSRASIPPYAQLRANNGTRRLLFSAAKIRVYLDAPRLGSGGSAKAHIRPTQGLKAGRPASRRPGPRALESEDRP